MAEERRRIASLAAVPAIDLRIVGHGTNPCRTDSHIYADGSAGNRTVLRCDSWEESQREVLLQAKHTPPPISELIRTHVSPSDLLAWKQSVSTFLFDIRPDFVVGIRDVRYHAADEEGGAFMVTRMDRGAYTATEVLCGDTPPCRRASLRQVLYEWVAALKAAETSMGLTYVDAHFGNFMFFEDTCRWKLIDLESFQPIYLAFGESPGAIGQTPAVPDGYRRFIGGGGTREGRENVQSFFTSLLHHKLEHYFVNRLRGGVPAGCKRAPAPAPGRRHG